MYPSAGLGFCAGRIVREGLEDLIHGLLLGIVAINQEVQGGTLYRLRISPPQGEVEIGAKQPMKFELLRRLRP